MADDQRRTVHGEVHELGENAMEAWRDRAEQAEAERNNLAFEKREVSRHLELARMRLSATEAAIKRVRAEHTHGRQLNICRECGVSWPCSTIAALDPDTTGETETPDA